MIYRNFNIEADNYFSKTFNYYHEEFDGAPDANDRRHGSESTIEECKESIDQWHMDNTKVMVEMTLEELLTVQLALSVYSKTNDYSWLKATARKIDQALVDVQKDIDFERSYTTND